MASYCGGLGMPTPPCFAGRASSALSVSLNASLSVSAGRNWYVVCTVKLSLLCILAVTCCLDALH